MAFGPPEDAFGFRGLPLRRTRVCDCFKSWEDYKGGPELPIPDHWNRRPQLSAEELAQFFHEAYEMLAPNFGYKTREASAVPWEEVPKQNKDLMVAVCQRVIERYFLDGSN